MKKQGILGRVVNEAYLSIGSNLGDKKSNLDKAKYLLFNLNIQIINCSSIYETDSWPNNKHPKFLNIVLHIKTTLDLLNLFLSIKKIETVLGRKKKPRNYPRVCDIDIIDFNGWTKTLKKQHNIIIPHPRMFNRNFVLFPLFEINNNWFHPKKKINIVNLISNLSINQIRGINIL